MDRKIKSKFTIKINNNVSLEYKFQCDDRLTYYDEILLTLNSESRSYILEKANYYVTIDDIIEIISDYQSDRLLTISDSSVLKRGIGYCFYLKYSEIESEDININKVVKNMVYADYFLFGRKIISDVLVCCYKYKQQFFLELSNICPLEIPEGKEEKIIFMNWLNNHHKIFETIEISDNELIELSVVLKKKWKQLVEHV